MTKGLILVKFGGSVITDLTRPNTARISNIRRLIGEIKKAKEDKKLIIGHGGGSFPHIPAHRYKINSGLVNEKSKIGTAITQSSAAELHSIMINEMIKQGLKVFSFSPSSSVTAKGKRIILWDTKPIEKAISYGFLPVVYGDVAIDTKQGVCIISTEEIFRYLAGKLKPDKLIIGTDVDGVFTDDPKTVKNARLIKKIDRFKLKEITFSDSNRKFNVTGSMKSKVELLYEISKKNASTCQIVNAEISGRISNAIAGKKTVSTIIKA